MLNECFFAILPISNQNVLLLFVCLYLLKSSMSHYHVKSMTYYCLKQKGWNSHHSTIQIRMICDKINPRQVSVFLIKVKYLLISIKALSCYLFELFFSSLWKVSTMDFRSLGSLWLGWNNAALLSTVQVMGLWECSSMSQDSLFLLKKNSFYLRGLHNIWTFRFTTQINWPFV